MRLSILKFEGALLGALSRAPAVRTRSGAARFASLRTCAWLPSAAPPALVDFVIFAFTGDSGAGPYRDGEARSLLFVMRTLESGHIVFHDIVPDYKTRYVASDIAGSVDILGRWKRL